MRMRFLPDEPLTSKSEDLLGLEGFAGLLRSAIENAVPPFVFGVLGDWGVGKTSTMALVAESLSQKFICIAFNPWRYENEANLIYPLLHAIKKEFRRLHRDDEAEERFLVSFARVTKASLVGLTDLSLRALSKAAFGESLGVRNVAEAFERVEADEEFSSVSLAKWIDSVESLQGAFEAMLKEFAAAYSQKHGLGIDEVRFVIFTDDLERCAPEVAVTILERIKHFLCVPGCIHLLAMNSRAICRGVQAKYKMSEPESREYLEKILGYAFYVPAPEATKVATFASGQLSRLLVEPSVEERFKTHFGLFGEVLERCEFVNPRKIKRILNRFLLFLGRYETRLENFVIGDVIRLLVLAEYYPDFFRFALDKPTVLQSLRDISNDTFDVSAFEEKTGVALGSVHLELKRMRALFDLVEPAPADGKYSLAAQAREVFAISRS